MGAALNNHSELTRRGFRIRGGFACIIRIDRRKIVGVVAEPKQSNIGAKADNVLKVAYLLLIDKTKIAENQTINSYLWCPEQDSNLHVSQHSHLKRARLPFRHLGRFCGCKVRDLF